MIKNYLKIALKVLLRRKLFTCISLFGISFTIMLLIIVSAEVNSIVAPIYPEINLNRTLFIKNVEYRYKKGLSMSNPSYYFLDRYVKPLQTPEKTSIYSSSNIIIYKYQENGRLALHLKYTDSRFWEILRFDFIEGSAFSKSDVDNLNYAAVISENTKTEFFGNESAVGKNIVLDDKSYRIVGVVKDVNKGRMSYADVWIPLSTGKYDLKSPDSYGFEAMLLARSKEEFANIKKEFYGKLKFVESFDRKRTGDYIKLEKVLCPLKPYSEWLERGKILGVRIFKAGYTSDENESWLNFNNTILIFMIFIIILPILNLVNMNITRISERSSEISVRKTFGASSLTLSGQFIIENLILTLLGGIIGFILAASAISLLNNSAYFESSLRIDFNVALSGLLFIFVFGLLSGVYPAYKMSRLNPVEGLRGGK